jgi:hypothetical protein
MLHMAHNEELVGFPSYRAGGDGYQVYLARKATAEHSQQDHFDPLWSILIYLIRSAVSHGPTFWQVPMKEQLILRTF